MRRLGLLAAALLVPACGGGGVSPPADPGPLAPLLDQRGMGRVGPPDLGAFERQ